MEQEGYFKYIITKIKLKDDSDSDKCRIDGNKFYVKSDFYSAIICYNMAIAFAETDQVLSLAYANRSAAYFEAKKYRECIKSIKLARDCGYPAEKLRKLNEREEKCLKLIENDKKEKNQANDVWDFFKLSYPANEKIPWIIEGLKTKEIGQYSKGVYATRDLRAGDIIAIEDINIFQTDNDGDYKHCAKCFKTNMLNLIPCIKSANYMYCSTECRNAYYQHSDTNELYLPIFNHYTVYINKMRETFGGFKEILLNMKPKSTNLFDFDFSDPVTSQYNKYKCLITSYNFECSELPDSSDFVPKCVFAIESLLSSNSLKYTHTVSSSSRGDDGKFFSYFGFAMKTSCACNVNFVCIDNKCIFYVEKPIKAGEELFISLADPWFSKSVEERKNNILTKNCKCIVCTANLSIKDLIYANSRLASQMIKNYPLDDDDFLPVMSTAKNRFDLLNRPEFNGLTSMERCMAICDIITAFQDLAYKTMFP